MIEATDMIEKMGKRKFVEFALRNQTPGQRMLDIQKRRRWGRNVKFRKCEHGVWTIDNYVHKRCPKCYASVTKPPDFQPHFNHGLGVYVESRSDLKKAAKLKGLIHVGSDGIR